MAEKATNTQLIVGGLGRPFTLGMLYNAPKDELVPGLALWDSETLTKVTLQKPLKSSFFYVSGSDSTKESSFNLTVDASLKLSFMSGMVEVGGSANYLNDKKEFKNQSRVILWYKATTHFEQLCLTEDVCEKIQKSGMNEKGLATHVVTGIEYGANAYFVFDSQMLEANDVQAIKGQMEATIKKIPKFDISGEAKIDLTDAEKKLVKTFSVYFFGDFLLESNPATFDTAVQTYVTLPKLLIAEENKKNPMNTVPVRVWMLPLEVFTKVQSGQIIKGISVGLVIDAENTLEELSSAQRRCNDCLSVSAVGKFPELNAQLHKFYKLCHYYIVELQRQMAEKVPAIREGKIEESVLKSLLDERKNSPFSQDKLTQWLEDKEREVNVVDSTLEILSGVRVLSTQAEVDRFVLAPGDGVHLAYVFTSLETTDAQLVNMGLYLDSLKWEKPYVEFSLTAGAPGPQGQWYYQKDVVAAMRKMAAAGMKATPRFHFVTAINNPEYAGAATYQYQGGILQSIKLAQSIKGSEKDEHDE